MDDADLDRAVDLAVNGAFGGTGQKCTASSRLIVHRPIHDAFVERFLAKTEALKVGHALEEGVQMGPVVSQAPTRQQPRLCRVWRRREGAELAAGGDNSSGRSKGYYMAPTVFLNTAARMRVNQEEMFGPITCVLSSPTSMRRSRSPTIRPTA